MATGWNRARRARQALLIHRWKPWQCAKGPKTAGGKQIVARNAFRHGLRSKAFAAERKAIREMIAALT